MSGRFEIVRHKQRIDAVIARAKALPSDIDDEVISDMAKYICVLVSGFLEKSVSEMLLDHSRRVGAPTLQRFVESSMRNFTNAKTEKLLTVFGNFDPAWRVRLELLLVDEVKDALDSVVATRHQIAHGNSVGLTLARIVDYYEHIDSVVEAICETCDPL